MADNEKFTPVDLDNFTLDDIDDLPSFKAFPTGAYLLTLPEGIEKKVINEHPAAQVSMRLDEIIELNESNLEEDEATGERETPPKVGDIATVAFMLDNVVGAGFFKEFASPIGKHLGTKSIADIVRQSKGLQILAVLQRTAGKGDDKDKRYQKFVRVAIP